MVGLLEEAGEPSFHGILREGVTEGLEVVLLNKGARFGLLEVAGAVVEGDHGGAGEVVLIITIGMVHLHRSMITKTIFPCMALMIAVSGNTNLVTQPIINSFVNVFQEYQNFIVKQINCLLIEQEAWNESKEVP